MNKEKFKGFFKGILGRILGAAIYKVLILLGTGIVGVIAASKFSDLLSFTRLEKSLILTSLCFLVVGMIIGYIRFTNRRFVPERQAIQTQIEVIEKEIVHSYKQPLLITHRRTWKIKARVDGVSSHSDRFAWSGTHFTMKSNVPNQRIHDTGGRNLFSTYIVQLQRTLKKNEEEKIDVEWELHGPHKPFVSSIIDEPTKKLTLTVCFPRNCRVSSVTCTESGVFGSKLPYSEVEFPVENSQYTWVIANPRLFHNYEISWDAEAVSATKP